MKDKIPHDEWEAEANVPVWYTYRNYDGMPPYDVKPQRGL